MKTIVFIPTPFLSITGQKKVIQVDGYTAGEVLDNLTRIYHPLRKHIYSDNGKIRSFINIYLNDRDIKLLNDEDTILKENDVIKIIPSISGGV